MCTLHVVKNAIWNRVNTYITNVSQVCQPHCSKIRSMFPNFKNAVYVYNVAYCWLAQCTHYTVSLWLQCCFSLHSVSYFATGMSASRFMSHSAGLLGFRLQRPCWTVRVLRIQQWTGTACAARSPSWSCHTRSLIGRWVVTDARLKSMNAISLVASIIEDAAWKPDDMSAFWDCMNVRRLGCERVKPWFHVNIKLL